MFYDLFHMHFVCAMNCNNYNQAKKQTNKKTSKTRYDLPFLGEILCVAEP